MMKSYILSALALGSAFLSFFYEVQPSSATTYSEESLVITPTEQLQEWALEHNNFSSSDPVSAAAREKSLSYKDSLFYNYYSQSLGLHLDYDEDKALLETVSEWIGTPYRSGGNTQRGTDCSGFVSKVYKQVYGINLTHSSRSMFHQVNRVSKNALETGDLVFFRRGPGQPIYHVGIYLEDGKFIHAASKGGVMINSLMSPYYKKNFYAAGRAL
ncbi:C40 family peptidase [Rufibacter latericius]|uniref:NlpC/P60 family protein n=1 Tax=Rufibacter latericius TaxID=2487040 RepID=A0A3M9MK97_9BACT|nr:C40 family peptidase [Rufibacter latericius]RNI25992.1 NlpC/P60 family protein [Rufibacter latericius]